MNMVLYYGVILDPRHKLGFVEFSFDKLYGGIGQSDIMKERVRDGLHELQVKIWTRSSRNFRKPGFIV